jgi:hypothetical protein
MERQRLDAIAPDVLDLVAEILRALHAGLCGHISALRADRTERYRRGQLIGENSLPLEDFIFLLVEGGEQAAPALEVLVGALGYTVAPVNGAAEDLHHENADFLRAAGEFEARMSETLSDGHLTPEEREDLLRALHRMLKEAAEIEPALRKDRP